MGRGMQETNERSRQESGNVGSIVPSPARFCKGREGGCNKHIGKGRQDGVRKVSPDGRTDGWTHGWTCNVKVPPFGSGLCRYSGRPPARLPPPRRTYGGQRVRNGNHKRQFASLFSPFPAAPLLFSLPPPLAPQLSITLFSAPAPTPRPVSCI